METILAGVAMFCAIVVADVERTSGGIIDQEWRATIGVRYGF